jgi:hypothetical protein
MTTILLDLLTPHVEWSDGHRMAVEEGVRAIPLMEPDDPAIPLASPSRPDHTGRHQPPVATQTIIARTVNRTRASLMTGASRGSVVKSRR